MTSTISDHFTEALHVLKLFIADKEQMGHVEEVGKMMVGTLQNGGKIISCGNGGSMCDAMHFAEELSGRYRENREALAAVSISDPSHITCVANDYGFDFVFSRYVEAVGRKGDVLLAISTSGNSPNILKAAEAALAKGMHVAALTGKNGGALAKLATVEIRVPHQGYADRIQEIHIKVIHSLIDYIERHIQ